MVVKTTKKRQKKRKENGWRLSGRPKSVERKNIEKWRKNGRRCDRKYVIRYLKLLIFQRMFVLENSVRNAIESPGLCLHKQNRGIFTQYSHNMYTYPPFRDQIDSSRESVLFKRLPNGVKLISSGSFSTPSTDENA